MSNIYLFITLHTDHKTCFKICIDLNYVKHVQLQIIIGMQCACRYIVKNRFQNMFFVNVSLVRTHGNKLQLFLIFHSGKSLM